MRPAGGNHRCNKRFLVGQLVGARQTRRGRPSGGMEANEAAGEGACSVDAIVCLPVRPETISGWPGCLLRTLERALDVGVGEMGVRWLPAAD